MSSLPVDEIVGLWQHQLRVFSVEREWNKHVSQDGTKCAICSRIAVAKEVRWRSHYSCALVSCPPAQAGL